MKSLLGRVERIENHLSATSSRETNDLSAIRNRCRMIMEVTDDEDLREDLFEVIQAIDEGRYPAPAPLPANWDERAKVVRARMLAEFS